MNGRRINIYSSCMHAYTKTVTKGFVALTKKFPSIANGGVFHNRQLRKINHFFTVKKFLKIDLQLNKLAIINEPYEILRF